MLNKTGHVTTSKMAEDTQCSPNRRLEPHREVCIIVISVRMIG